MITYKGETKSVAEWSEETGIAKQTLFTRLNMVEAGELGLDEAFLPAMLSKSRSQHMKNLDDTLRGRPKGNKRVPIIEAFYEHCYTHILPTLEAEIQTYMVTGEEGNGLKFLNKYQRFFPPEMIKQIDPETKKIVSNIVIVQGQKPTNFKKVIDG